MGISVRYNIDNTAVDFDIVANMQQFVHTTQQMYVSHLLKPDDKGSKLFHNIDQRTLQVVDRRITTYTIINILKSRLRFFFARARPDISQEDIELMVEPYSSHSLKRGAITDAASKGANKRELQVMFHFKNTKTPANYVDQHVLASMGHAKKPTILPPASEPINLPPLVKLPTLKQNDDVLATVNPYCAIMPTNEGPCNCDNKLPLKKRKLNPTIYQV